MIKDLDEKVGKEKQKKYDLKDKIEELEQKLKKIQMEH